MTITSLLSQRMTQKQKDKIGKRMTGGRENLLGSGVVGGRPIDVSSSQVEYVTVPDKNIVCGWA